VIIYFNTSASYETLVYELLYFNAKTYAMLFSSVQKILDKPLDSLVSKTRQKKQDCNGMGTCSEEKMIAVSKDHGS